MSAVTYNYNLLQVFTNRVVVKLLFIVTVFQDKKYDMQIGVKSTAQRFDDRPRLWLAGFTSAMMCGLTTTGWLCQEAWPYYLGISLFATHLGRQVSSL